MVLTITGSSLAIDPPSYSQTRGFYSSPLQLTLSSEAPSAQIRYTTDGSAPSASVGLLYSSPIDINTTSVVRAIAYTTAADASVVACHTYIFLSDVLHQPAVIPGWPNGFYDVAGGFQVQHDHEMDPNIVNDPVYGPLMIQAMRSIPTFAVTANVADMFGPNGFYDGSSEKPASIEILYPSNPTQNIQANCGIESHSHRRLKRSLRLSFKSAYGPSKLRSSILEEGPLNGDSAADDFDGLVLRAGNNRSWTRTWNPDRTAYTEDEWYRASQIAVSGIGSHGTFVHLYINGLYWGLYNACERPDESFEAEYQGGHKDNWFSVNHDNRRRGSGIRWDYLRDALKDKDMTVPANYDELRQYLDVANYSDYLILSWYATITDWPTNNWWGGNRSDVIGPHRYYAWDGEWSWDRSLTGQPIAGAWIHPAFRNGSTDPSDNAKIWRSVKVNPDFMMLFADRVHEHLFYGGALTDANSRDRWRRLNEFVRDAIIAESARWGDALESLGQPTRTRDIDWQFEVNNIDALMQDNAARFIGALRAQGYYPSLDPPTFSRRGGLALFGFACTLTNPNSDSEVYYTIDSTDPRAAGGGVAASALLYEAPVVLPAGDDRLRARAKRGDEWSALDEANILVVLENHAPVVDAGPPQSVTLPATAELVGTATDDGVPDGILTSVWSVVSRSGAVTLSDPSQLRCTASFSWPGLYTLRLTGSDGLREGTGDVVITVYPPAGTQAVMSLTLINADTDLPMPGFEALTDGMTLNLGTLPTERLNIQATTYPETVGSVRFAFNANSNQRTETAPPYAMFGDSNGNYNPWTPTLGTHTIRATPFTGASAGGTAGYPATVQITVIRSGNQPPEVSAGPNQTIALPASVELSGTASDDGLPDGVLIIEWTKVSGPGSVEFADPAALNTTATFSTPGVYLLRLSAGDGVLTSGSDVRIIVNAESAGDTAVASISLINADTDLPIPGFEAIADGSVLDMSMLPTSRLNIRANTNPAVVGSVRFAFDANPNLRTESTLPYAMFGDTDGNFDPWTPSLGAHFIRVTPYSGPNASGAVGIALTVNITVIERVENRPPVVSAGVDQTITLPASATLAGTATDDGLPSGVLTTQWWQVDGPGTVAFDDPAFLATTASFSTDGTYALRLSGSDGVLTSTSDVWITVHPEPPIPTAVISLTLIDADTDQPVPGFETISEGNVLDLSQLPTTRLNIQAITDPPTVGSVRFAYDADPNTHTDGLSPYSMFGDTAGDYDAWTPSAGAHVLTAAPYSGVDATGHAGTPLTILIEVIERIANLPPVIHTGENQTVTLPASATLMGTATDDGQPIGILTTEWSVVDGPGAVTIADNASLTTTASFSTHGVYTIRLSASDGELTSTGDVLINVHEEPPVPTAVISLTLIDADTDQPVPGFETITEGNVLDLALLPTTRLNIRANTDPPVVGSVQFVYDADVESRTDGLSPYSMFGDTTGDYDAWTPSVGVHVLTATSYSGPDATGAAGTSLAIQVEVIEPVENLAPVVHAGDDQTITLPASATLSGTASDDGQPDGILTTEWSWVDGPETVLFVDPTSLTTVARFSMPGQYVLRLTAGDGSLASTSDVRVNVNPRVSTVQKVVSLTLINADTDQPIPGYETVPNGTVLILENLPTTNLNMRANTDPPLVGSVRFTYDAKMKFRTESEPPYALAGDEFGDYLPWTPTPGPHSISARPYTQAYGRGTVGISLIIYISVR